MASVSIHPLHKHVFDKDTDTSVIAMAYLELTVALARVIWLYDMRLAPGSHVGEGSTDLEFGRHRSREFQLKDTFTSAKDGPMVEFTTRV